MRPQAASQFNAVVLDPVQQGGKAKAGFNRVSARHSRVVELADHVVAHTLSKTLDGGALALVGVLVSTDVGGRCPT